ncbi:MAG: VanZ family protein [Bacteroidetes bacterium]|nr:VanZ family protein [Bacteroidota bacterium]
MSFRRRFFILLWLFYFFSILYLSFANFSSEESSMLVNIPYIDKIVHFLMYFLLSLFGMTYLYYNRSSKKYKLSYLGIVIFIGIIIEFIQPYFGRGFEVLDMFADVFGAVIAWAFISFFSRLIKKS